MALTVNHPLLKQVRVQAHSADIGTAGSAFTTSPIRGKIVKMGSIIHAAITTADATITTKINGTAITGGSWTVTQSGSAAGDVDTVVPTAANFVNEDDAIEFASDGASTGSATTFWAIIEAA